ncbi:serine hydrolase [Mycobacterium camsae]|uniref:serine hydrolase n=1 Tax=Mycobacterium gordonae TaxID=1778 RepID=UPI00240283A5|nr:serine hydrolase [Mycobacterium gordonae]
MPYSALRQSVSNTVGITPDVDWSICIRDAAGDEVAQHNSGVSRQTASVGKLLLLAEVARQCDDGSMDGSELLDRNTAVQVADSGIWQHLHAQRFSVRDLCVLVASVSDNLATNVLLDRVGLNSVQALCGTIGFAETTLLDRVRDHRGPDDVWTLSVGTAAELSEFMCRLATKRLISMSVSDQLTAWLATGVDLSMVASAFGLDPLAHTASDRGFCIRNKTGTDTAIRADVGTIERNGTSYSYAVIANWDAAGPDLRDTVLAGMRSIGGVLRDLLLDGS